MKLLTIESSFFGNIMSTSPGTYDAAALGKANDIFLVS